MNIIVSLRLSLLPFTGCLQSLLEEKSHSRSRSTEVSSSITTTAAPTESSSTSSSQEKDTETSVQAKEVCFRQAQLSLDKFNKLAINPRASMKTGMVGTNKQFSGE